MTRKHSTQRADPSADATHSDHNALYDSWHAGKECMTCHNDDMEETWSYGSLTCFRCRVCGAPLVFQSVLISPEAA